MQFRDALELRIAQVKFLLQPRKLRRRPFIQAAISRRAEIVKPAVGRRRQKQPGRQNDECPFHAATHYIPVFWYGSTDWTYRAPRLFSIEADSCRARQ